MRCRWVLLVVLAGVWGVSAACAREPAPRVMPPPTATPGQAAPPTAQLERAPAPAVLRIGMDASELSTLDPHFAAATGDRAVADMVFNGLLRYAPGQAPTLEPDLAESIPGPENVAGRQVWTFKLRRGVMCQPGPKTPAYELTADDVVYSLNKSADPSRSAYAGEYTGLSVKKVDEYTVAIIAETPLSPHLFLPKVANYAGGFIVCQKAIEAMGAEAFKTYPVGTGPFQFEVYVPKDKIRLTANEHYFRGRPWLDAVEVFLRPDIASRESDLRMGWLDVITGLNDPEWIEAMARLEGLAVDVFGVGEVVAIHFNLTARPLDDVRVRRAMAYALDRDGFLAIFGPRVAAPVYSIVPPQFLPGGLTKEQVEALDLAYAVDREKARRLLAEAGYPNGFSLEVVTSDMWAYRKTYKELQTQLAQVGIELKINVVDHAVMHQLIRQDANPLVVYVAWRPNADVYLTRFFHSASAVVTGSKPDTNFSHCKEIDDLIEAARRETDPDKQAELWKHAQIKLLDDMIVYPILYLNQNYARRVSVDYGHPLIATMALYPQVTEKTQVANR